MHPILFHIGSLTIYTYGVLVALGFMVGSLWVAQRAKEAGENVDLYLQGILGIIIAGFIGARVLYVIYFPQTYLEHPIRIILDRGGLVWYGGLIAAGITSFCIMKLNKLSIAKFGDIVMVPAALGLAIGRIGCFMAGCCYGKPTNMPWGVQFPPYHLTYPAFVHPTELYESASLILLTIILQSIYTRSKTPGVTMALFFVGYGIIRFTIEYLRGDVVYWIGHIFTASQVFSLIGILVGLLAIWFLKHQRATKSNTLSTSPSQS